MSKQEAIRNAARAVKAHGLSLPAELDKQIAGLENPQYRVAVVGEYQVGKSTLVNRVFLGDKPLLAEGRGLCTTSVATDIEYGDAPTLEIYDWTDGTRENVSLVKTVSNPTENDVNDATVSSAMETRAELAKKRARVAVKVPNEALRGFTVVDTPGLDDPNQELLLDTTWRIIPGADVALLVVRGDRQLGDVQLSLLRKEIMGKNGLSRLMVLASFNPTTMEQDAAERTALVATIKAQLANIGRENIPVEMYCFDPAIGDIMSDVSEIRMTIRNFLSENALPGREEKVANLLRAEIEKDLVETAVKLKTAGASEADRAALAAKVDAEVSRFKEKAERAFERFQDEIKSLDDDMMHEVDLAVEAVFDKFLLELEKQSTVADMKSLLAKAETVLKSDLQDKISIVGLKLKSDINTLVSRYGSEMETAGRGWNLFLSKELDIKTGMVAKIPTLAYDVVNVVALNLILPGGGWVLPIVGHIIGKQFLNPTTWVAKKMILSQVKSGLEETKPEVRTQIMQQVDAGIQKTFSDVKSAMEASNREQVASIRSALSDEPAGSGDRAALESAKADLESALAAL